MFLQLFSVHRNSNHKEFYEFFSMMEKDFVRVPMIKFLLLGNSCKIMNNFLIHFDCCYISLLLGVGKTSMLLRYVANEFRFSTVTTIGLDFKYKDVLIGEQNIKLQVLLMKLSFGL